MNKLSIKVRVTIGYTVLVMLICSMLVGAIIALNEPITEKSIYELLESEVEHKLEQLNSNPEVTISVENAYISNGVYLQIYDKNGDMIVGELPSDFGSMLTPIGDHLLTTRNEHDGYLCHCKYSDNGEYIVRGIMSKKNMKILITTVLQVAMIATPFLVILAFVGGISITRLAFKPLDKINRTVEEIAGGNDLSKRIAMENDSKGEIATLSRNFDKMMERLEEAFECEKQFTADASHELRTPVSVILAQCQCAMDEEGADVEALETISRQAKKMSIIISRLLTLTRIDKGLVNHEMVQINVSNLVNTMTNDIIELNPEQEITSEIEDGLYACANVELLNMAYENLITNACRYGKGKAHITLKSEDESIVFSVSDNGEGIPKEELDKIWNRFYRSPNVTNKYGTGLGLAFVKESARLHCGEVLVESTIGEGSCFKFIIKRLDGAQEGI